MVHPRLKHKIDSIRPKAKPTTHTSFSRAPIFTFKFYFKFSPAGYHSQLSALPTHNKPTSLEKLKKIKKTDRTTKLTI
jgi:hypothetical protein